MKYIKKNVQVIEPTINEEGYYVVGNVAIHPDVFHQQYQPADFTLTAEDVKFVKYVFGKYERDYVKDEWESDMLWNVQQKIKEYEKFYTGNMEFSQEQAK